MTLSSACMAASSVFGGGALFWPIAPAILFTALVLKNTGVMVDVKFTTFPVRQRRLLIFSQKTSRDSLISTGNYQCLRPIRVHACTSITLSRSTRTSSACFPTGLFLSYLITPFCSALIGRAKKKYRTKSTERRDFAVTSHKSDDDNKAIKFISDAALKDLFADPIPLTKQDMLDMFKTLQSQRLTMPSPVLYGPTQGYCADGDLCPRREDKPCNPFYVNVPVLAESQIRVFEDHILENLSTCPAYRYEDAEGPLVKEVVEKELLRRELTRNT